MARVRRGVDIHANVMDKMAEKEKRSRTYSTERIKEIMEDKTGHQDLNPFWKGQFMYRDSGVQFEYTDEELEELERCSMDCLYFVEHYAKFKNDKGITLVKLRDYQKRLIKLYSEEVYDEVSDAIIPANSDICLLQSRQTGKCVTMDTTVCVEKSFAEDVVYTNEFNYGLRCGNEPKYDMLADYVQLPLYELYYFYISPSAIDLFAYRLYRMRPNSLRNKVLNMLEIWKYGTQDDQKIIESVQCDFQVMSDDGPQTVSQICRTKMFQVWHLELDNNKMLECADNHLVYTREWNEDEWVYSWTYVRDLKNEHMVLTDSGWSYIKSCIRMNSWRYMCDLSIDSEAHAYYTNGIKSHNTTTTAAFFSWILVFHDDKTCLVAANKEDTGKEIISKIKTVIENLPFFMKPGVLNLSEKKMKFENGSSVKCAAASKTPATGDSIQYLYVDEFALIPENIINEYWGSVYPTMSNFRGHQVIVSSTPRGTDNLYYELYSQGIPYDEPNARERAKKEHKFITSRVHWREVPGRDAEWEARERAHLGDDLFNREYDLSFESSSTRLASTKYMRFIERIRKQFVRVDFYNVPEEISAKTVWHPDFHPDQLSYQDLMTRIFLFVIDSAQGMESGAAGKSDADFNIINIFEVQLLSPLKIEQNRNRQHPIDVRDVVQYRQVGLYADNFKDEKQCAEAAKFLAFHVFKSGYGEIDCVRILVEMNFNGANWLNTFKSHPSWYEQIIIKTPNGLNQGTKIKYMLGFKTTTGVHGKKYYCDLGAKMMDNRQIIVQQWDPNDDISSQQQLQCFGKDKNGKYKGAACHDDIAITCFFVSIAGEQMYFRMWLDEWLERLEPTMQVQKIRWMLEKYVETEEEISDDQFSSFYKMASQNFGRLTRQPNTYGGLMNGTSVQSQQSGFGGLSQYGSRYPRGYTPGIPGGYRR